MTRVAEDRYREALQSILAKCEANKEAMEDNFSYEFVERICKIAEEALDVPNQISLREIK